MKDGFIENSLEFGVSHTEVNVKCLIIDQGKIKKDFEQHYFVDIGGIID